MASASPVMRLSWPENWHLKMTSDESLIFSPNNFSKLMLMKVSESDTQHWWPVCNFTKYKSRSWCEFGIVHFLLASDESPERVRHRQWVTRSVISTLGQNPPQPQLLTRNKWLVIRGGVTEENISGVKMVNRRVTRRIVCLWMNNIHMYEHNHSATTTPLLPRDRPLRNLLLLAFNPDSCKKILRTW